MARNDGITVSYDLLEGKSKEMKAHKDTFITLIAQTTTTIKNLSHAWDSKAQQNFAEKFEDMRSTYDAFEEMLRQYEVFLHDSAEHYRDADVKISQALNKSGF